MWLYKAASHVYLHLHLDQKSKSSFEFENESDRERKTDHKKKSEAIRRKAVDKESGKKKRSRN